MNFLVKLGDVFYEDTFINNGEPVIGKKVTISKARQDMLYYLGAHTQIIRLLKDGMHTLASLYELPNEQLKENRIQIRELFTQCHKILRRFVYQHPKNQKRIHKDIYVFLQHLRIDVDQIPLICEIYKDNYNLVLQINKDIIKCFKKAIYSEGRRPIFLELFDVIQTVKGRAIPQNQRLVINFFIKEEFNRFLLYMNDDPEPEFIFEVQRPKHSSWSYQDIPYEYHGKLLSVLSKSGFGVNGMYLNEAKCQKLFRLNSIFKLLSNAENKSSPFYRIKIQVLDFLFHIYIDCEKTNEDVKESSDFFSYIRFQAEGFDKLNALDSSCIQFLSIWIKILNKYCYSNLSSRDYFTDKEDFTSIQQYSQALVSNVKVFQSRRLPEFLLENISMLCSHFKITFPNIQYEEFDDINTDPFDSLAFLRDDSKYELKDYSNEAVEYWNQVKENLIYSDDIKESLRLESKALCVGIYKSKELGEGLTFEVIVQTLVNFIRSSRSEHNNVDTVISAIELLGNLIENPVCGPYDDLDETKAKIQDEFNSYGASRVVLTLLCDPDIDQDVFVSLLEFSIQLLEGGNIKVQQEFYQYFVSVSGSERFFEKLHRLFTETIAKTANRHIIEVSRIPIYKTNKIKIRLVLRLVQLFCEGHYNKLQNYVRHQEKSRVSYDMVADIISLLEILLKKMHFKSFPIISQCFDTLTELIQGPCKENQESIIDGKFLELATYILSLDENRDDVQLYDTLKGERSFARTESVISGTNEKCEYIKG